MYNFDGITIEALMLLEQNRFNNSKSFYEENKEKINRLAVKPLRQIAAVIGEEIIKYDPLICTVPTKMVSRVRRDTRFTKDKALYRNHLWVSFQRPKADFPYAPGFWFGIEQDGYNCGMGFYRTCPQLMETYRAEILKRPDEFKKALRQAEKAGITLLGESYKKPRSGSAPSGLEAYYNMKEFYFFFSSPDLSVLQNEGVIDQTLGIFKNLMPMYVFLMECMEKFLRGEENER